MSGSGSALVSAVRDSYAKYRVDLPESVSETLRVERFTISETEAEWERVRGVISGSPHRAPRAGTYTRIVRNDTLWMSDTDAEVRDHLPAIRQIERRGGRVLVNGLGIGLIVHAALAFENVEHIDIVEVDPEVCEVVGGHYARDSRVQVHCADAHKIEWPAGARWNVVWSDIWPTITLDDNESRARLGRKYSKRVADWHGKWAQEEVDLMKREERRQAWW